MKIYTDEEYAKDNQIVKGLEEDYKSESDPVRKAEKELYYHYMYEARRMKILAKDFQFMVKNYKKDLLEEIEWSIYVNHLFGGGCLSCQRDHMYAEKPWAEEMAKSMGRETWKHMVAKLEEKMESENQEDGE